MNYFNLIDFYKTVFLLTNSNRLSLFEIYDLYPWEYEIYLALLNDHLESEQQRKHTELVQEGINYA